MKAAQAAYANAEVHSQRQMLARITKPLCFYMFGNKRDHCCILLGSSKVFPCSLTDQLEWPSPVVILT